MVIEGSERDGDLGGSGDGSLIECFWITDMYIKYFGMVYFHVPCLTNFTGRLCIIQCLLVIYNWVSIGLVFTWSEYAMKFK